METPARKRPTGSAPSHRRPPGVSQRSTCWLDTLFCLILLTVCRWRWGWLFSQVLLSSCVPAWWSPLNSSRRWWSLHQKGKVDIDLIVFVKWSDQNELVLFLAATEKPIGFVRRPISWTWDFSTYFNSQFHKTKLEGSKEKNDRPRSAWIHFLVHYRPSSLVTEYLNLSSFFSEKRTR